MTDKANPSGITGNTPAQINAGAAKIGTANREDAKKKNNKLLINLGIGLVLLTTSVILANAELSFAWKLVVIIGMIVGGGKLAKANIPALKQWAGVIKAAGWIVLIVVALMSGFGQWTLGAVDSIEQRVSGVGEANESSTTETATGSSACPEAVTASVDKRPEPTLKIGCVQKVYVANGLSPQFMALDSQFDGPLAQYVTIRWTSHSTVTLTPKKEAFPAGATEVKVAILTEEEAAPLKGDVQ